LPLCEPSTTLCEVELTPFKRNGDVTSADTTDLKDGQKLRKEQTNGNAAVKLNFVIQVLSRVILTGKGCGD
jgi:hypothetical protein